MRLLNGNDKTVLRLEFEQYSAVGDCAATSGPSYLRLCPVRGYPKYHNVVSKWLTQQDGTAIQEPVAHHTLTALNLLPHAYSAKLQFDFDPMTPAETAMKTILRFLLGVMRQNEAGIIEDIDTEFLHDFRVAIRRTRAALGQIKAVFPEPVTARCKRDFAYLGKCTTRLRDLDVYLLQQETYTAKLPLAMQADITPLFDYLGEERRNAHQAVVRLLHSKRYAQIMSRWEAFVEIPAAATPAATLPIRQVASKRIRKKSRAVMRLGQHLLHSPDEEGVHDFRLECKKLRYLMEFFSSLFTKSSLARSIQHVKTLQDTLGDFHDLCVQQVALKTWSKSIARQPNADGTLLAMGHLIGLLEADKQRLRQTFPKAFKSFVTSFSAPTE
jgi:CHAD domain-containing protein